MQRIIVGILLAYPAITYSMIQNEENTFNPKPVNVHNFCTTYNFFTVKVENNTPFPISVNTRQTLHSIDGLDEQYNNTGAVTIQPKQITDIACMTKHSTREKELTISENFLFVLLTLGDKAKSIEARNNLTQTALSSHIQIPCDENDNNNISVYLSDIDKELPLDQLLYSLSTRGKLSFTVQ